MIGHTVAHFWSVAGHRQIFILDSDGRTPRQLTRGQSPDSVPTCTPDGKWLLYSSDPTDVIQKVATSGGSSTVFLKHAHDPVISPDGRFFTAHVTDEHKTEKHAILSMTGALVIRTLTIEPTTAVWMPEA